jgi:hypothetical protein
MELEQMPVLVYTKKMDVINKDMNIYYPVIVGNINPMVLNRINTAIVSAVNKLIYEQYNKLIERGYENPKFTMDGWFELKNNQRGVLSLSLGNYTFPYPSAHGLTILKSLTFGIQNGKEYDLSEMFKSGSNYVKRLSDIVSIQIKERNIDTIEDFKSISPNQDYYIADKCLVLYFQLYELTPYSYGFPFFPISIYEIEGIISEDSPLYKMLG